MHNGILLRKVVYRSSYALDLYLKKVASCRSGRMASSDEVVYRAGPMTSSTSSFSLGMDASADNKARTIIGVQPYNSSTFTPGTINI